tara:strand:+ start:805 stop:1113 length:309 start_codon:yes stop_codon:yes gene_type:complete
MKIDTQGMSLPLDPNYKEKTPLEQQQRELPRATIIPRRLFTDTYVKELKILINEVLDEREGKMDYVSYFDTKCFSYLVGDEEPTYKSKDVVLESEYKPSYYQ